MLAGLRVAVQRVKDAVLIVFVVLLGVFGLLTGLAMSAAGTGLWPLQRQTLVDFHCETHRGLKGRSETICWGYTTEQKRANERAQAATTSGGVAESTHGQGPERVWSGDERPRKSVRVVRAPLVGWVVPGWEPAVWGLVIAFASGAFIWGGLFMARRGSRVTGRVT